MLIETRVEVRSGYSLMLAYIYVGVVESLSVLSPVIGTVVHLDVLNFF